MPRAHPSYTAQFKADAVTLVRTSGRSIPTVARDLGINIQTLRNWVHQAAVDAGNGRGELTTAEPDELRRLRRDVGCHGCTPASRRRTTCARSWCWRRCGWRWVSGGRRRDS